MTQHTVYDHNYYNTKRSPSCPNGSTHSRYIRSLSVASLGNNIINFNWVQVIESKASRIVMQKKTIIIYVVMYTCTYYITSLAVAKFAYCDRLNKITQCHE